MPRSRTNQKKNTDMFWFFQANFHVFGGGKIFLYVQHSNSFLCFTLTQVTWSHLNPTNSVISLYCSSFEQRWCLYCLPWLYMSGNYCNFLKFLKNLLTVKNNCLSEFFFFFTQLRGKLLLKWQYCRFNNSFAHYPKIV